MHLMKAIAIFIACIFAGRMIDGLVLVAPLFEARVNVVLVGVQQTAGLNYLHQYWFDRHLLHIGQHPNHDFAGALQQAQDRWLLIGERPTPAFAFQAPPAAFAVQLRDNFRVSFVPGYDVDFIGFNLAA